MMKQYGIDPRLAIWIQRNTGHDLQTFSDLAKMKSLDSRRRNFSSARKIEDIRLPSWLMVKENDFALIGEMTKLNPDSRILKVLYTMYRNERKMEIFDDGREKRAA